MKPITFFKQNEPMIWMNSYEDKLFPRTFKKGKSSLLVNNLVNISIKKGSLKMVYLQGWSD